MRFIVLLTAFCLTVGAVARGEIRPDFAMDLTYETKAPDPIVVYPEKHRPLWLKALARPEADLQRRAADAIAEAHLLGTPGLAEAKPTLLKIVSAESTYPTTRLAAARALIALNDPDSAETLVAASRKFGSDLRQLIEPVLAKWKYQPIHKDWQQRLEIAETRHRDLMLAIDGVQAANLTSAVSALLAIVHDAQRPGGTRLAASRAAGRIQKTNLESDAEKLLKPATPAIVDRLCAVSLLEQHRSPAASALLLRLAPDQEPSIAAAALSTLNLTDPQLVVSLAEQNLRNRDANVRLQGIATCFARPTPERVIALARLLDDPHSGVRSQARERLFALAHEAQLDAPIIQSATEALAGEGWRGQEQAALLLASLDHKPAAARLVQLLESPRGEVMVASAWGLRTLAVPDTLPAIFEKVRTQTELRAKTGAPTNVVDAQVGHLCEALGQMKYAPAEQLLRQYVPKNLQMGEYSRSGAIWALGHLHAGVPDEPLAQQMVERLTEPSSAIPAEMTRVRIACAISLARMQAKSQAARMRRYVGPNVGFDPTSMAIRWAIHELTGETLPDPERPVVAAKAHWFLEPLD